MTGSGLVRARGLKRIIVSMLVKKNVRARKSPWIETLSSLRYPSWNTVRARKSPWIETAMISICDHRMLSGLVRARGLKLLSTLDG